MKLLITISLILTFAAFGKEIDSNNARMLVEQMRDLSMQHVEERRSDGSLDPEEKRRQEIIDKLRALGPKTVPTLVGALNDSDVQMRRNIELTLIWLAGAYDGKPKMDICEAVPALIEATKDKDTDVRAWAAHALAEIGPNAKPAIPALLILINDEQIGPRNTSCMALGSIGPAAQSALPALQKALSDPSEDVQRFARRAIKQINTEQAATSDGDKSVN